MASGHWNDLSMLSKWGHPALTLTLLDKWSFDSNRLPLINTQLKTRMHSSRIRTALSLPGMVSLCPGGRSLSRGFSVQGGLCPGGSLSRGYLFKGVSVRGSLSVDRQTPVKILLCPKLRLRAVIVSTRQVMQNVAVVWRCKMLLVDRCTKTFVHLGMLNSYSLYTW